MLYLKLHTKDHHIKSENQGKLINEEIYKKVIKDGHIAFQASKPINQIGDSPRQSDIIGYQ